MDIFPKTSTTKLTLNREFEINYQNIVSQLWETLPVLESPGLLSPKNDFIKLKGEEVKINGIPYDLIITEVQGFKTVYLDSVGDWERDRSILKRQETILTYARELSPEKPELYSLSGKMSRETGLEFDMLKALSETLSDANEDQEITNQIINNILDVQSFEYYEPKHKKDAGFTLTNFFGSTNAIELFFGHLVDRGLLDKKFISVYSDIEQDIYPQIEEYLPQIQIQYNYLKNLAIENNWNYDNQFRYNDLDNSFYLSDKGNLVMEDQNIYYEFFQKEDGLKIIGLSTEEHRDSHTQDNSKSSAITLDFKDGKVIKADSMMVECFLIDIHYGIKALEEDGYSAIQYPVDVNTLQYQKDFWMSQGNTETDALIKIFLSSEYNEETKTMDFSGKNYLLYKPGIQPTTHNNDNYKSYMPLYFLDRLSELFEKEIDDLNPDFKQGVIDLYNQLKADKDFGDVDRIQNGKRIYKQLKLDDNKCKQIRQDIYKSLNIWTKQYAKNKTNELSI